LAGNPKFNTNLEYYMNPRIETLKEKRLVGYNIMMCVSNNKTGQLWGRFAPRIKEISNKPSDDKISMQIYPPSYFNEFNPNTEYAKWATVEVTDFENIPNDMESFLLKGGLYAVFDHKGNSSDHSIFEYIYGTWVPNSQYELDDRPHFEILGSKYKNNAPDSEEEIWIPIREK